jgi:hypothetical protein
MISDLRTRSGGLELGNTARLLLVVTTTAATPKTSTGLNSAAVACPCVHDKKHEALSYSILQLSDCQLDWKTSHQ